MTDENIIKQNKDGFALIFVFFFIILIAGIVLGYLYFNSASTTGSSLRQRETQSFYAAEAAQARAEQYLQNNWAGVWDALQPASGVLGTFTLAPMENMAANTAVSYEFIIDNWNLALNGHPIPFGGTTAAASSTQAGNVAARAINGAIGNGQFWRSAAPFGGLQSITINFPAGSNYSINECRFRSLQAGGNQVPRDYVWETSSNGGPFITRLTVMGNVQAERYDFFPTVTSVTAMRLTVTAVTGGNSVRIDEIEIPWIRIKSRCRISSTGGTSYTEKYIRSIVLTSSRGPGATISRVIPSSLANTSVTGLWDEISQDSYYDTAQNYF
jgi:hypothetical protein